MKRWLPAPLLSASLVALWLLLEQGTSPGDWVVGLVLALAMPLLLSPLRPTGGRIRRPLTLVRLILVVGGDVVLSALQVGVDVLRGRRRDPHSRFVVIPLALRDPAALAALAVITTVVPGTVWSELAPDRSALLLHVFDVDDESAFIARYRARYEAPLREIFE